MTASTTICLDPKVKEMLATLKHHSRESYNSVIERLAKLAIDEKPLSDEAIKGIEEALVDIKQGRLHSEEEIMKEFDLK
jgi:predicted transcriptional regulator